MGIVVLYAHVANDARAAIVNGGFENGFTGWTNHLVVVLPEPGPGNDGTGLVYSSAQLGQLTPTDGSKFAVLEVSWIPSSEFSWTPGGARISQTFKAQANDLLSFQLAGAYQSVPPPPLAKAGAYLNGSELASLTPANGGFSETWMQYQFLLPQAGNYNLAFEVEYLDQWLGGDLGYLDSLYSVLAIDRVRLISYGAAENPVLPTSTVATPGGVPVFNFTGAQSGQWFDPPATSGFSYQMTSGSLFTKILDFPAGFDSPFVVSVDGSPVGQFGPGQSVDFTGFAGGGVSSFQVSGINPTVNSEDPMAFPLQLQFSTSTADFSMQAIVPEPSTLLMAIAGLVAVVAAGARCRVGTAHG
jgi:hypothetical protein